MEKRLNLRFNLNREAERKAWEFIERTSGKSRNKQIIWAINAYAERQTKTEREEAFLNRLVDAVRQELRAAPALALAQLLQPQTPVVEPAPESEETEETILDFLDGF